MPDGSELLQHIVALLTQALKMIDSGGLPDHIGPRLQHVIDDLQMLIG